VLDGLRSAATCRHHLPDAIAVMERLVRAVAEAAPPLRLDRRHPRLHPQQPRRSCTGPARLSTPAPPLHARQPAGLVAKGSEPPSGRRLVGRGGSALARRVTLRGGRNARPVSSGPSGPTRGQGGAPAAAGRPSGRPRPSAAAARRYDLDAGVCRAGWYSRRVRASAERGRVQGPGRAEADPGPRTVTATGNCFQ
jgi:hypothetical protein